nr:hypothetical protein [Alphaproteobacteria bacterium]
DRVRARALLQLRRPNEAIILLLDDTSEEGDLLRAEIHLRQQDWAKAASELKKVVERNAGTGDTLSEEAARHVLNWTVAKALAGDRDGLQMIRDRYGDPMAKSAFREPFSLLTSSTAEFGDIKAIADQVSLAESFGQYMANRPDSFAPEADPG